MKSLVQKYSLIISGALLLSLSFLVFSCKTITDETYSSEIKIKEDTWKSVPLFPQKENILWDELHPGIRSFSYSVNRKTPANETNSKNGKLQYYVVEIDFEKLSSEGVEPEFFVKKPSTAEEWTEPESVETFAKNTGSFIAVNTNPFELKQRLNPFGKGRILGICIENGKIYSEPLEKYSAIAFYNEDNSWKAQIFDKQTEILTGNDGEATTLPDYACGGFWTILDNGEVKEFKKIWDTRNAVATRNDGKNILFLSGEALTFMETAEIFKVLGAEKAMQLDGGNSTALVVDGKVYPELFIRSQVVGILGIKFQKH